MFKYMFLKCDVLFICLIIISYPTTKTMYILAMIYAINNQFTKTHHSHNQCSTHNESRQLPPPLLQQQCAWPDDGCIAAAGGTTPSSPFFCLTRRFWNQIFTCFSDNFSVLAISMRRKRVRYWLAANSRSSSSSWRLEKAVRMRLHESDMSETGDADVGGGVRAVAGGDADCGRRSGECFERLADGGSGRSDDEEADEQADGDG